MIEFKNYLKSPKQRISNPNDKDISQLNTERNENKNKYNEIKSLSSREYIRALTNQNETSFREEIYSPIISALISLKNIEIDQINTQIKTSKSNLSKIIFF